jgi:hypothetical protein
MAVLDSLGSWLEATQVAQTVGSSMWIVASLSAVHVLGYALVMGGALVGNLRLLGLVVPSIPVNDVVGPASRGIAYGLVVSIVTGILLVSWKAVAAFGNDIFRIKMLLLLVASLMHFAWQTRVARVPAADGAVLRMLGAVGLLLWLGLAAAAASYILFE